MRAIMRTVSCRSFGEDFFIMTTEETLIWEVPSTETYALWGTINHAWAMLDVSISGAFCNIMNIDVVELGIVVGRLDPEAKLAKMQKILLHRKEKTKATQIGAILKTLNKLKPERNAITHGNYLGTTKRFEMCFNLTADFLVSENTPSANSMVVITVHEMMDHGKKVQAAAMKLLTDFGGKRLDELLRLPSRTLKPVRPAQPLGKKPKKGQPPHQS